MEVSIIIDDESVSTPMTTFANFTHEMTVYDIKKRIKDRFRFAEDKQMLKIGDILLADTFLIKQIPSDDSQRYPEKAVHISSGEEKGRLL